VTPTSSSTNGSATTAGADRPPADDGLIRCFDPASRELLGIVRVDGADAVDAAVARARDAQRGWALTSFAARRRVLRGIADRLVDGIDDLCGLIVSDSGKTRENALMGEIWPVCEKLRWTIAHGERHLTPERVSPGLLLHKRARLEFEPRGVIGAIVAWNYPCQNVMNPVIPALMAGNAVVVKPSEWVAWSAPRIVEIVREALVAEGCSPDVVQLVQGHADTGRSLVEAGIDGLVFIGSVPNGRAVLEAAARSITPVVLELGGKDPFIVCDDADLERAAHAALAGCFVSAGQNCVAAERLLVFDRVYDEFERMVGGLVARLRQDDPSAGAPVDVGAMTTPLQLETVERLVARAVEQGARVVTGGRRALSARGDFFAPTVLADVTPEMEIMNEETFGPVMVLCRVRDEHEAVRVANATAFGLSSSVFSRDGGRARRIAGRLKVGMTALNDFGGLTYMAQGLTFGGVKASGFGRMNGRDGLRALCNVRAVLEDRFPMRAPRLYPVGARDFTRTRGAVELIYGSGPRRKLLGAAHVARSLVGRR
jgi:acyl-CoA reductase-like NAD-dependent aldehyde dehydrogenase